MTSSRAIFDRLKSLIDKAYAPYSNFQVAAAVVDERGEVHYGVNVENQSYPVGTCAEAAAIAALRLDGGSRVTKLYLLSKPNIGVVPCGACRQRVFEFSDPNTTVISFGPNGEESEVPFDKLFPSGFRFK